MATTSPVVAWPMGDQLTSASTTTCGSSSRISPVGSHAVPPTNTKNDTGNDNHYEQEEEEIIEEEIIEEVEIVDEEIMVEEEVYSEDEETMEETILDEKPLFITFEDDPQSNNNSVRMTQAIILGRIHPFMKGPIGIPWSDLFQNDTSSHLCLEWRQNLHTAIINGLLQSFPATTARRHVQHLVKSLPLKMTHNSDQQLRHCQPLRNPDDLQQFAEALLLANNNNNNTNNALCFVLDGKLLHTHPNWNRDTLDPDWVGISPFVATQDDGPIINTSGRQSIMTMSTLSSYETLDDDSANDHTRNDDDDDDDENNNFADPHQSSLSTTCTFFEQDNAGVCLCVTDDTERDVTERLLGAMQPALEFWFDCHETAFLEPNPFESIITTTMMTTTPTKTPMPQTPTVARIMTATAATPERSERSHKTNPPAEDEKQQEALAGELQEKGPEERKEDGLLMEVVQGEEEREGDGLVIGAIEGEDRKKGDEMIGVVTAEEEDEEGGGGDGWVIGAIEAEKEEAEEEAKEEDDDSPLRWAVKASIDTSYDLLTDNGGTPREEEQRRTTVDDMDQSNKREGSVLGETDVESDGPIRGDNSNVVTPPRSNLTKSGDSQGMWIPPLPSVQRESHAPTDEIGTSNAEMTTPSQRSVDQGTPENSDKREEEDESTSGQTQSEGRRISEDIDRNGSDKEEITGAQSPTTQDAQHDILNESRNLSKQLEYKTNPIPNFVDKGTDKRDTQMIVQKSSKVYETRQQIHEGPSKKVSSRTTQEEWKKYSSPAVEEPFDVEAQQHTVQRQQLEAQTSFPDAKVREVPLALQEYMMQKQKEEERAREAIKTIRIVLLTLLVVLPFTLGLFFTLEHETTD